MRHLLAHGWQVAATDSRAEPPGLAELIANAPQVTLRPGGFDLTLLEGASLAVASPGVPSSAPILAAARARGIDVVGDIELFARAVAAPAIGITGTNGKSTVTTLLGQMAEQAGIRVKVGGNLGTPALELLELPRAQLYVLELSSYQLETTRSLELVAATVLNVTPDHMDRYRTIDEYAAAKARIFARCGTAVVNLDDARVVAMPRAGQRTVGFSATCAAAVYRLVADADGEHWLHCADQRLLRVAELRVAGVHNAANALAALALGDAAGLPRPAMLEALRNFRGLEHRSQWVADRHGVRYVDDSKGTNVGATLAAVAGLTGPLLLIAGGDGKNQDFGPLAAALRGKVRRVLLIGRDAPAIARAVADVCPVETHGSLRDAVFAAARAACPGDTVLLSPACSSLDMFRDYAHRGAEFAAAVAALPRSAAGQA